MAEISFRPAHPGDIPMLRIWDEQPHVIASISSDGTKVDDGWVWEEELKPRHDGTELLISECDDVPFGFLQVINPATEISQYWGEMPQGFRALDIWIGPKEYLGKGLGTKMMQWAFAHCFSDNSVHTILIDPLASNTRAHRFYERLGFRFLERRKFDEDSDCYVMQLSRLDWQASSR